MTTSSFQIPRAADSFPFRCARLRGWIGPGLLAAVLLAVSAQSAQAQVASDATRAASAPRSCVQQARSEGITQPVALRAALQQCTQARAAERKAQPRPVLIDGRGISAPAP